MTTRPPNEKELAEMKAELDAADEDEDEVMIWEYDDGSLHISPMEIQRLNEDLILDRPRSLD